MANSWYHAFEVQMSWEVVGLVITLLALAYLIGRKAIQYVTVKKACEIKGEFVAPKKAPHYDPAKEIKVRRRIRDKHEAIASRRMLRENSTVMVLHSSTFDNVIAGTFAFIFIYVFAKEHFFGLVQFFINHLGANDSATWGDIFAFGTLGVLFAAFYEVVYCVVRVGQMHTVAMKSESYLNAGYMPLFFEKESLGYSIKLVAWYIERKRQKKQAAEAKAEAEAAKKSNIINFLETA